MRPVHKSLLVMSCAILTGLIIYTVLIRPLQKQYEMRHVSIHGLYLIKPLGIQNFELVDQNGKAFTKDNLRGHWSLLFFGFTHCGMVCPVTLASLNQFYQRIEKNLPMKDRPQIVFITIDPTRDTLARLKEYLLQFNRHFTGARTSAEKMQTIKNQFHITAEKVPSTEKSSGQYNHSTDILLVNPEAEIQAYFHFPQDPAQLEKDYRNTLKKRTD